MEKSGMNVISGNYFTDRYVFMLTNTIKRLSSSCYMTYNDEQVSLKSNYDVGQFNEIVPGKRIKITCFNPEYSQALYDLNKVRELIEHDFTATIEST